MTTQHALTLLLEVLAIAFTSLALLDFVANFPTASVPLVAVEAPQGVVATPATVEDNTVTADINWVTPVQDDDTTTVVDINALRPCFANALALDRLTKIDYASLKTYALRGDRVVKVSDIPVTVPDSIKRYRLRSQDVVRLSDLQTVYA